MWGGGADLCHDATNHMADDAEGIGGGRYADDMPPSTILLRSQLSKPIPRKLDRGTEQEDWAKVWLT